MRTGNRKSPSLLHCFAFHRFVVYKKHREIKTIILILLHKRVEKIL